MSTETAVVQILNIPLAAIRPLENYRKAMNPKKMAELTESIRKRGNRVPVLLRPWPENLPGRPAGVDYQLVYGNRRYLACQSAERETIFAMIENVPDEDVLELQVIENSQREDPNPMEEGLGFKRLLEMGKHTPETLATRVDHSVDYVLGRIKLCSLPQDIQDKLLSEEIAIGHALQLTRLKNEGDMKRLCKEILEDGMSVQQTRTSIRNYYGTPLKQAEFDFSTGNCMNCPSRTRNQSVLFPDDKKDDLCLDQSCFFTRTREHYKDMAKQYSDLGIKVLTSEKEIEKVLAGAAKRVMLDKDDERYLQINYRSQYPEDPKKPADCKKCGTRNFYMFEHKSGNEIEIHTGWICRDLSCLHKMNKVKTSSSGSRTGSPAVVRNGAVHSRACRDRFLYSVMPERLQASPTLTKRLTLFHLLKQFTELHGTVADEKTPSADEIRSQLLQSFLPGRDISDVAGDGYMGDDAYAIINAIPAKNLDRCIERTAHASLRHTDPEVLFRMMPEAGVTLEKHFKVDQPYLNSLTKQDLIAFAKMLKIKSLVLDEAMKKTEMIQHILQQNLIGSVPDEIAEECQFQSLDELCPRVKADKKKAAASKGKKPKGKKPAACDGNCDDCAQSDDCDGDPGNE